jgi:putative ABC transport system permease protein
MNIFSIPIRNLKRKLARTIVLILVFTAGIVSVVSLYYVSETVGESLEKELTAYGANIVMTPKSDALNVNYGGYSLGSLSYEIKYLDIEKVTKNIKSIELAERISAIAPKLIEVGEVNESKVAMVGINWVEERKIKSYWFVDGKISDQKSEAVLGKKIADKLSLKNGDKFIFKSHEFVVTGVLATTGGEDDNFIFTQLEYLQQITSRGNDVNFIEVSALCAGCPIGDIVSQVSSVVPGADVNALQKVVKQRMHTLGFVKKLIYGVGVVILVIACFMLTAFMLASVNERAKEIGILRSVGYSKRSIFLIFTFEALFIGVCAGVVGYVAGFYSSIELLPFLGIKDSAELNFTFFGLVICTVLASVISMAASIYPARRATKIEPAMTLTQI